MKNKFGVGSRYGRLVVLEKDECRSHGRAARHARWFCQCDCGQKKSVFRAALVSGDTRSCGCLLREFASQNARVHGHSFVDGAPTPTYRAWCSMWQRCRSKDHNYTWVLISPRWRKFENFLADMGERPEGMTLDRRDPWGHYVPQNCRWANATTQARNRRTSRLITAFGVTKHAHEWAQDSGLSPATIWMRVQKLGWTPERAVSLKAHVCKRSAST